jgi:hypothetical protein
MKRLKEFLELLIALVKAWPILVSGLLLLFSLVISLSRLAKISYQLSIPLPVFIAVAAFIFYPIGKTVQWLMSKPMKPFNYAGLKWKPSKLSFRYPTPLCPYEGCGYEIIAKADPAVNVERIAGPFIQASGNYHYTFECPIHGVINGTPNEEIVQLQKKARILQKRNK